jgi:transglutaminase-like putative cysteine protease
MTTAVARQTAFIRRLRTEAIVALPTFAMSAVTAGTFIQVFGTWDFFSSLIGVALIVHACGIVARSLRFPAVVSFVFAPISVVVAVGWVRFGDSLRFGLPLSESWEAMWGDLRGAWDLIGDVVTPVEFASGFGTMSLFVIAFVASVTDSFASRYGGRAEVFVPAAATLFIVATVGTGQHRVIISIVWLMAAILSTVLLRRTRARREDEGATQTTPITLMSSIRSVTAALAFAAIVGLAAASIGPLLPGADEEAWLTQQARGEARELQPLVDLRRQLTEPSSQVLFTVRADRASYWRISALPDFDGATWTVSQDLLDSAAGALDPPLGVTDSGVDSFDNYQKFEVQSLTGSLAPVAPAPTRLRASSQSLFFEPDSGSLIMGGNGLRPGEAYEMVSTMLSPRPERLEVATSRNAPSEIYLELPDNDEIEQLRSIAATIVPAGLSPYRQALALQDYFRTQFTYSLDVPALSKPEATLEFLERRSGYCEQFSSTFALFARVLGLPARVAIGFTPGDRSVEESGALDFVVRSIHAHAWPEVWFDGLGWVLFEPTPGRGAPNSTYTNVPEEQADESATPTTTPTTTTTSTTPSSIDVSPATSMAPLPDDQLVFDESTASSGVRISILIALSIALIALWVIGLHRLMKWLIGRRDDPPIMVLWRRCVALYEFERGEISRSLSPIEVAAMATSRLYDDDPFILELADFTTRILFDRLEVTPETESDLLARGRTYLAERRRRLTPTLRLRARVDPIAMWKLEGGSTLR